MTEPRSLQAVPPLLDLLADQRQRWARGDHVLVETYLEQHPALGTENEAVLDLIYNEVFLREGLGDVPSRDEYLRRFPHLAGPLAVQFDVHQAIHAGEASTDDPGPPSIAGFEVLEEIGRGGMGRVYQARHLKGGRLVAIKVLRAEAFRRRGGRRRFVAETQAATALDHPHIIKVFEVGETEAGPYFVMELIEGPSLDTVIRQGPPAVGQAIRWLIPVAQAVHHAHGQGIIHRDLKPANIMIDQAGRPRVMDFGMAKVLNKTDMFGLSSTQRGTILGTPCFMPPEQAGETETLPGPYSDVYSLGAIFFALLTGRPPFDEGTLLATLLMVRSAAIAPAVRSLRPEVPEGLAQICHKCLNKDPADRYPTAKDLADALVQFQGETSPRSQETVALFSMATGGWIPLVKQTTVIGRAAGCDLVLQTAAVSRRHCQIVRTANDVLVVDLGSTGGTRVNGSQVHRAALRDGDWLQLAGLVFQVRVGIPGEPGAYGEPGA